MGISFPDWNFFLKKRWAQRIIEKQIKPEQAYYLKELTKDAIESPQPLETDNSSDSQMVGSLYPFKSLFSIYINFPSSLEKINKETPS